MPSHILLRSDAIPPEPAPAPFSPENTSPFIATDRAGAPVGAGVASQEDIAYMTGKHNVIRPDRMSIEELKSGKPILPMSGRSKRKAD